MSNRTRHDSNISGSSKGSKPHHGSVRSRLDSLRSRNDSERSHHGTSLADLSTIQRLGGSLATLSHTHTDKSRSYQTLPQKEGGTIQSDEDETGLKPKLTLLNGVTFCAGSIIGSGIFIAPGGVLKGTGSVNLAMIVWIVGGLFSMIGSVCYAELGCMIHKPGGDYTYVHMTFGPFVGFMRLWVECVVVRPCTTAIVALTFAVYVVQPFFPTCDNPESVSQILAAVCILILTFVNCWNVKWATRVQDVFTFAKLLALFIIIITGFVQLGYGKVENFTFDHTEKDFTKVALSFYSGLFAYNGWNYLNFVIEELKDPVKNLPKAIYISITLVTVVYVLTNVAFYTTLTPQEIRDSPAVAVTFGERLYQPVDFLVPVFVALSTFGSVNGILFTSSRLFYAGALEGQMPEILTMIQVDRMTPTPAVLFMAALSLVYLGSSDIGKLIDYVGFATWLSIGLAVVCVPYLRWKCPDMERPIKVNLVWPILYIIATLFITIVPMIAAPMETGIGLCIIMTGLPVYLIFIKAKKPVSVQNTLNEFTLLLQKLMMVVRPSQKKS